MGAQGPPPRGRRRVYDQPVPQHQKGVKELVLTQEQYDRGYLDRDGMVVQKRPYDLIRKLPDGNYLVRAPDPPKT